MLGVSIISLLYLPRFEVAAASCQEVVVRMPVDAEDGRTNRLLDVLTHPPESEGKNINISLSLSEKAEAFTSCSLAQSNTQR